MFKLFKKKSKLEEFYGAVHKDAFPGGTNQIETEVSLLADRLESRYPREKVKSILIKSTSHLYLSFTNGASPMTVEVLTKKIMAYGLPQNDALVFVRHLMTKVNSPRH